MPESRIYHRKIKKKAIGMTEGGRTKIAVSFPTPLFQKIAGAALKEGLAFQEKVRRLCLKGFDT